MDASAYLQYKGKYFCAKQESGSVNNDYVMITNNKVIANI